MSAALALTVALLAGPIPADEAALGEEPAASFGQVVAPVSLIVQSGDGGIGFEPNSNVAVAPTWRNSGAQDLPLVTGAMSNFTGPAGATYAILDGAGSYGALAAGASAACFNSPTSDCYSLRIVAATRPATHWDATVTETITPTGDANTWTLHIGSSFADVPRSSSFQRFVEAIVHKNVTAGCTPTTYCPFARASREQMAVFVLVARELPGYSPPGCASPLFSDVPASSPYCRWIEELARRGVVTGCGGGNYCPLADVTRAQITVFSLRTLEAALVPPPCGVPLFSDVPASSPFCRWVEEMVRRQVVNGCGGTRYCPDDAVTRETMSVFIAVTFGLPLYGL